MTVEPFEPDDEGDRARWDAHAGGLVVDLDGYEGPLDVLLALARDQKVDLARISILQLADQYLSFIERARDLRLEVAADYLVMAAWLAYLKSRLLLPEPPAEDVPTGEEIAQALAFQLRRLEAMRAAGAKLMRRPLLGRDVFARGAPEGVRTIAHPIYEASFFDLLRAYADHRRRTAPGRLTVAASKMHTVDEAMRRLTRMLGGARGWQALASFLPPGIASALMVRSALAATLCASLELARQGRIALRQSGRYAPIYLRARSKAQ